MLEVATVFRASREVPEKLRFNLLAKESDHSHKRTMAVNVRDAATF
jgi:hypothetical protein